MKRLLILAGAIAAVIALTAWPRLTDVETGRTPEYPDLRVRAYTASEAQVVSALKDAMARLPGWTLVGSGRGAGGSALTAVRATRFLRLKDDVSVKVQRQSGTTRVSVRSRSRLGKLDFGQNARNIRELLTELDRQLN